MKALSFLFALLLTGIAQAQIDVGMELKRKTFLRGEPIEAKVSIRNMSGHDITLHDVPGNHWFSFEIMATGDTPVAPLNRNYRNEPVTILSGETVTRSVDILRLFPVNEFGTYKVRAAVYFDETSKYYASRQDAIDVSDGRVMWSKTVGVPTGKEGQGELRTISLLSFQTPKELTLYGRVTDDQGGMILATYPLGRILAGATPMVEFNDDNTLYAFHMTGPNLYALSKIGVNGEWLGQTIWAAPKGRATVRRKPDGTMVVIGATRDRSHDAGAPEAPPVPKLSDAPPIAVPSGR